MDGITKRCIGFAQGNKDPFQRVNYPFGLVLGVDEFVDEQCYFLEKEYLHNRALHGSGTVSGLLVTVEPEGNDIEARVAPGIGIDQYGRLFVVRTRQCASLPAWIAEQELGVGAQTIYVVARYAECESELVPIAGQPCSSSDQLSAPSRIKDFFAIDFVLTPPPHPAHVAAINLAEFLHRFRRDPSATTLAELGSATRLSAIIGPTPIVLDPVEFRTHINNVVEAITGNPGDRLLRILPQEVQPLLEAIFTYWVTSVRPTLTPDLITPAQPATAGAEPPAAEILLARIDLTLGENGLPPLAEIIVDNSIRPYLLHTQLIQELFTIPDLAGTGGTDAADKPVLAFAIIEDVSAQILSLWLRVANNVVLRPGQNFQLQRIEADGSLRTLNFSVTEDEPRRNDVGRYFRLRTTANLNNGDHLLLRFATDDIPVETPPGPRPLTEIIAEAPFTFANYQPDPAAPQLLAFHVVDRAPAIDPAQIRQIVQELLPPEPRIPFVTITPLTVTEGRNDLLQSYELWFHLDGVADRNEGAIDGITEETVRFLAEDAPGSIRKIGVEFEQIRPNVVLAHPQQERELPFVRVAFLLDAPLTIKAFNPLAGGQDGFGSLREYIKRSQQQLEGHIMRSDQFGEALVLYIREQGRAWRVA